MQVVRSRVAMHDGVSLPLETTRQVVVEDSVPGANTCSKF